LYYDIIFTSAKALFYAPARPSTISNRFARELTYAHGCKQATKIHFMFNLYTHPPHLRQTRPPATSNRHMVLCPFLHYHITYIPTSTSDMIIRDLPLFPASSSCWLYRILTTRILSTATWRLSSLRDSLNV